MDSELINNYTSSDHWMIFVLIIAFGILAFINHNYKKTNRLFFKSLISVYLPGEFIKKDRVITHRSSILLLFCSALFTSLLILILGNKYSPDVIQDTSLGIFFLILMFVIMAFLLKVMLHTIFIIILEDEYGLQEYIFNSVITSIFTGIALIPIVLSVIFMSRSYQENILITSLILIVIFQLLKIFKGTLIAIRHRVNILYFIMYLCCFEIIPVLVLVKEVFLKV